MAGHLWLDLDRVEDLAVVDADDGADEAEHGDGEAAGDAADEVEEQADEAAEDITVKAMSAARFLWDRRQRRHTRQRRGGEGRQ